MPLVTNLGELVVVLRDLVSLGAHEVVAIDTETTGLALYTGDVLRGVSVAYRDKSAYISVTHPDSWNVPPHLHRALSDALSTHLFALPVFWNAKFDFHALELGLGWPIPERYVDAQAIYWLLDENQPKSLKKAGARLFGTDADAEQRALKAMMRGESQADAYKRLRIALAERLAAHKDQCVDTACKHEAFREAAAVTKERAKREAAPGRTWANLTAEEIAPYAEQDTVLTKALYEWETRESAPDYAKVEPAVDTHLRLIRVVQRMERRGLGVDLEQVRELREHNLARMAEIEAAFPVNLASPAQLGRLIYDEWQLPVQERTETGAPSTSRDALEALEALHDGVDLILEYRRRSKLVSGYCDTLIQRTDSDGRVHASFRTTGTVTGRLSCNDPNLMTVPRDAEGGGAGILAAIRSCFVPAPGFELWSYDLSQAELRYAASLSKDAALRDAIESGDVYQATADAVFCTETCQHSEKGKCAVHRPKAKALVLAYPYGVKARKFARMMLKGTGRLPKECPFWAHKRDWDSGFCFDCGDVVRHKSCNRCDSCAAKVILDGFETKYPNLADTMSRLAKYANSTGVLPLLHPGRFRRHKSPALMFPIPGYTALNSANQAGVAGVMTDVMICSERDTDRLGAHLVLQVHDSLVYEVPPGQADALRLILQSVLNRVNPIDMPLYWEAKQGV